MKFWRIRIRKPNGRTRIIPYRFWSQEETQRMIDHMNGRKSTEERGLRFEMASCGYC